MSPLKTMGLYLKNFNHKIFNKLRAINGTPESVAKGFTTGVAVSFIPFVGFHILIALLIAKITKQSGVAATLGTIAGNPWTFPLIWYATWHTGIFLGISNSAEENINFSLFFKELYHTVIMLDFNTFLRDIWPIFLTMLIGCIPFCIGIWYFTPRLIIPLLKTKSSKGDKNNDTGNRV